MFVCCVPNFWFVLGVEVVGLSVCCNNVCSVYWKPVGLDRIVVVLWLR